MAAEVNHRGYIRDSLLSRRQIRRSRRTRTRYRQPRFRTKKTEGWLPPSLMSRVHNIITWVNRLIKLCPINNVVQELVRFDLQKNNDPEISGVEYHRIFNTTSKICQISFRNRTYVPQLVQTSVKFRQHLTVRPKV